MIPFVVFDPLTNEIIASGECAYSDLDHQGAHVVEGRATALTHYVGADGALIPYTDSQRSLKEARPSPWHVWSNASMSWQDGRSDQQRLDAASADAKARRDLLLSECDWVVTRAMEQSGQVPADWRAYRQALRDLTLQPGFPTTIAWPQAPATA
ncbi:MAG TPA: tail fiber assembly protein [Burkholderiaceae bacterium]|nr:tail fiber assembly protein [Burkholderiaceae bacterium]